MAKTKALISFAVTAKLIHVFVFACADCWFSHEAAQASVEVHDENTPEKTFQAGWTQFQAAQPTQDGFVGMKGGFVVRCLKLWLCNVVVKDCTTIAKTKMPFRC